MPFLGLGLSHFELDFTIGHLSAYQQRLAARLLPLADTYNRVRRENAERLRAGIEGVEGIEASRPIHGADPVYQRFPILARDERHRASLLARLKQTGIGASASYPTSIEDIPGIRPYLAPDQDACPGARAIAARIVTLPTHPGVTSSDIERMIAVIRGESGR
jgi:dTDP-4-amino-4,6-dideoxygalactose transaminase